MKKTLLNLEKLKIQNLDKFIKNSNDLLSQIDDDSIPEQKLETKKKLINFLKGFRSY